MKIELPFPSSLLAGHANGNGQWLKVKATKQHREWARLATLAARGVAVEDGQAPQGIEKGDIPITIRFIPGDDHGDRINFPNRMKPYFDGIADALKVNDKRFHPLYVFLKPEKPGRVEVFINVSSADMHKISTCQPSGANQADVEKKTARAEPRKRRSGHDHNAVTERLV